MAKQIGIHGLKGKVDGMSYYSSKNGGRLTRKINEGIGARVKSAQEYANTRKNNAEFGASGACAGLIMRTVPKKFRYILESTATGMLNKAIKAQMAFDISHIWGERQMSVSGVSAVQEVFDGLSKNVFPDDLKLAIQANYKFDGNENKVFSDLEVTLTEGMLEELNAIGATHYTIKVYGLRVDTPIFSQTSKAYNIPVANLVSFENMDVENAAVASTSLIVKNEDEVCDFTLINDDPSQITGLFVVFMPVRKIGDGYNTLQQHCSAAWLSLSEGTFQS